MITTSTAAAATAGRTPVRPGRPRRAGGAVAGSGVAGGAVAGGWVPDSGPGPGQSAVSAGQSPAGADGGVTSLLSGAGVNSPGAGASSMEAPVRPAGARRPGSAGLGWVGVY